MSTMSVKISSKYFAVSARSRCGWIFSEGSLQIYC